MEMTEKVEQQQQPPQHDRIENDLSLILNCSPNQLSITSSIKSLLMKEVETKLKVVDWEKLLLKKNEKLLFLEEEFEKINSLKEEKLTLSHKNIELNSNNLLITSKNDELQTIITSLRIENSHSKEVIERLCKGEEENSLLKEENTLRQTKLKEDILSLTSHLSRFEKVTIPLLHDRIKAEEERHLLTKESLKGSLEKLSIISSQFSSLSSQSFEEKQSLIAQLTKEQSSIEPLKKENSSLKQELSLQSSRERQNILKFEGQLKSLSNDRRSSEEKEILLREQISSLMVDKRGLENVNSDLLIKLEENQTLIQMLKDRKDIESSSLGNKRRNVVNDQCNNDILDDDDDQNERLKKCLKNVVDQLEAKIPEIKLLQQEKSSLLLLLEEKEESFNLLQQSQIDLKRQLCHIINDSQIEEGGEEDESSQKLITSDIIITKNLLPFKNIEELQEKNLKLLRAIRSLSKEGLDWQDVEEKLSLLQKRRQQQDKIIISLQRQRDHLRQLLLSSSSGHCGGGGGGGDGDGDGDYNSNNSINNNDLILSLKERCHLLREERDSLLREQNIEKERIISLEEGSLKLKKHLSFMEDEIREKNRIIDEKMEIISKLKDDISLNLLKSSQFFLDVKERELFKDESSTLKRNITNLQEEINILKGENLSNKEFHGVECNLLKEDISSLSRQRSMLERRLIDVGKEYSEFALSHKKIVSDLLVLVSKSTTTDVNQQQQQQQQHATSTPEINLFRQEESNDVVHLQNQLRASNHELEMMKIIINRDQTCYKERYESFINEINMLQKSKEDLTLKIPLMEEELSRHYEVIEERDSLNLKLSKLSEQLSNLQEERDSLLKKLDVLQEKINLLLLDKEGKDGGDHGDHHLETGKKISLGDEESSSNSFTDLMKRIEELQVLKEENVSLRYQLDNSPIAEIESKLEAGELRYQNLLKQSRLIAKERNELRAAAAVSITDATTNTTSNKEQQERIVELEIKLEKYAEAIMKYRLIKDLYTKDLEASKKAKVDFEDARRRWDEERGEVAMRHQLLVGNWQSRCKRAEEALVKFETLSVVHPVAEEEAIMAYNEESEEAINDDEDVEEETVMVVEEEDHSHSHDDGDDDNVSESSENIEDNMDNDSNAEINNVMNSESESESENNDDDDDDEIIPEMQISYSDVDDIMQSDEETPTITVIDDDDDSISVESSIYAPSTTDGVETK